MRPSRTRGTKCREGPSLDLTHNNLSDDVESMDTNTHKGKFIRVMLPKLNEKTETIGQEESLQYLKPWTSSGANLTPIKSTPKVMKQIYRNK